MSLVFRQAGYRYPSASAPAVAGVDLAVRPGELVLLTGPTGCGKSTLLRLGAGLLGRHGRGAVLGEVRVHGEDPAQLAPSTRVGLLGFVSQEPGDQLVTGMIGDELAFGMESAGASPERIEAALPGLLQKVGLDLPLDRDPRQLSGGQTQRLVVAAALAAGAEVLLLDEPIAQLDPAGALALLSRLRALADAGCAVLMVEHRLEACWPYIDRVAVMHEGRLRCTEAASALRPGAALTGTLRGLGLSLPGRLDLADRLAPSTVEEARFSAPERSAPVLRDPPLIELSDLSHRYEGAPSPALTGVSLALRPGERVALLGPNGAGKSTLLGLISGTLAGGPRHALRALAVPQDPDLALFCATVHEELAYGPREQRLGEGEVQARVRAVADALSVQGLLDRPPQALSRGQRLRVAVAAALACRPALLLLDEPTSGQDREQVERMMAALGAALSDGALLFATHDLDLALRHATRVLLLEGGRLRLDCSAAQALNALDGAALDGAALDGAALDGAALPELASLCRDRGLPPADAETLVSWVVR